MRILLGLIGGSLLAYLFHDRTMSYEDKRKKGLFRHRNFSAGFRSKKGVPMETFKVGDRVRVIKAFSVSECEGRRGAIVKVDDTEKGIEAPYQVLCDGHVRPFWCKRVEKAEVNVGVFKAGDRVMNGKGRFDTVVSVPGMKEYDSQLFSYADEGFVLVINGWQYQKYWRKMDTVSQYDTMKFRIENLQNGWDKDADDILAEIRPYMDKDYLLFIPFCSHGHIYIHDTQDKKDVQAESWASFYYDTQCEKMSAFKKALLWLLDHSSIKKDEKQEKIKELEGKVKELQEEIAKLK